MTFRTRFLAGALLAAGLCRGAWAQSDPLVSKSIPLVFAVSDRVFAFDDGGLAFSRLDLFSSPPAITDGVWPFSDSGGVAGGATWRESLLLRSNVAVSDTVSVDRLASLFYDGKSWKSDSLLLPKPANGANTLAYGAGFTALAVCHDTALVGGGRLGLALVPLAPENDTRLFTDSAIAFYGLPVSGDTTVATIVCRWNALCRTDTLGTPGTAMDSILDIAVDSSASDSVWLLLGTTSGLRRGLLGGRRFPHVPLPGADSVAVQRVAAAPGSASGGVAWAFTGAHFFFSGNHGRTFAVPPAITGIATTPDLLTGYGANPAVAFFGDTSFVNFNLTRPGLVLFRGDSLLQNRGAGPISDVLLDADDSLLLSQGEGSLTTLCVADSGPAAVVAVGSTDMGIFYKRLDAPGTAFANLNRLRSVQNALAEVITYPTVLTGATVNGQPQVVHLGYRLKKSGNVTITVYNYAMEKVRTIVKNAPRQGGQARSENPAQDFWDGNDDSGRPVSVGTYYILVQSDQGERGFGKAINARGRL